jgi:beta-lysine 5,6-aminomutase alpha subunit
MMRLDIDMTLVDRARCAAKRIADGIQPIIDAYTTTSIERCVLRLLGVNGVDENDVPLPNIIVDQALAAGLLEDGIAYWLGSAMLHEGVSLPEITAKLSSEKVSLDEVHPFDHETVRRAIWHEATRVCSYIKGRRLERERLITGVNSSVPPYLYVIVATGNIYEDVIQAKVAAKCGADIIAVIRSTGQSLLDYVPYGPTTEGFGEPTQPRLTSE